jgi:small neutral amino acid transporter SnatA (MarC family)
LDYFTGFAQDFVGSLITLFIIIHPFGVIPFFQALTGRATAK